VKDPEPAVVLDQLMRRYHYPNVAALLAEPSWLIDDFLLIMELEGKKQAEEMDKLESERKRVSRRR
jgi:hypothetical protein